MNPFSTTHCEAAIVAWGQSRGPGYEHPPTATVGDCQLKWLRHHCDLTTPDYLNWAIGRRAITYPALYVRGKLWMSLIPVEVQSCHVPIQTARGHVATAGLGLGYVPLAMARKRTVRSVTVVEREPDVISWFLGAFAGRPELRKIEVVQADAFSYLRGRSYDVVWMDVYDDYPDRNADIHARYFRKHNTIGQYLFWGLERVVLDALLMDEVRPTPTRHEAAFFKRWQRSRFEPAAGIAGHLTDAWTPRVLPDRQRAYLDAVGRPYTTGSAYNPAHPPHGLLTEFQLFLLEQQLARARTKEATDQRRQPEQSPLSYASGGARGDDDQQPAFTRHTPAWT